MKLNLNSGKESVNQFWFLTIEYEYEAHLTLVLNVDVLTVFPHTGASPLSSEDEVLGLFVVQVLTERKLLGLGGSLVEILLPKIPIIIGN